MIRKLCNNDKKVKNNQEVVRVITKKAPLLIKLPKANSLVIIGHVIKEAPVSAKLPALCSVFFFFSSTFRSGHFSSPWQSLFAVALHIDRSNCPQFSCPINQKFITLINFAIFNIFVLCSRVQSNHY